MKVSLVVLNAGKSAGHTIPVTLSQFIIGRDPQCNLRPASAVISKRHCAVLIKNGKVFLRDFDSTNGTVLNDKPVKGEVPLNNNDILKVGPLAFKVVLEKTPGVDKPTPPPAKKTAAGTEDDVAAMLLSLQENETTESPTAAEGNDIPGGSTVMEVMSLPSAETKGEVSAQQPVSSSKPTSLTPPPETAPEMGAAEDELAARKPPEKKPAAPPPPSGSARDAAKAILDKYSKRKRTE